MSRYQSLSAAIDGLRLPIAIVDLDALDRNIDALARHPRIGKKFLRIATKSIRSPHLTRYILDRAGDCCQGLMSFSMAEAETLAAHGHDDVLVAYPTGQRADARVAAKLNLEGTRCSIVVDSREHVELLAREARECGSVIPLVIELDMSVRWRSVHLGVLRSPLRNASAVLELAKQIGATNGVRLLGIMGYEAQVAGVGDKSPFSPWLNPIKRAIKSVSRAPISTRRKQVVDALRAAGISLEVFNGGGTGSLAEACNDGSLTEVTAGSGFLCGHLFDYYRDFELEPAAFFALQVVRRPSADVVTCHGGGLVASGQAGPDRLPRPWLPRGLELARLEGAGEVQTPLRVGTGVPVPELGQPVFFRHAKSGELAEHFGEYVLIRNGERVGLAKTYRGLGLQFP